MRAELRAQLMDYSPEIVFAACRGDAHKSREGDWYAVAPAPEAWLLDGLCASCVRLDYKKAAVFKLMVGSLEA